MKQSKAFSTFLEKFFKDTCDVHKKRSKAARVKKQRKCILYFGLVVIIILIILQVCTASSDQSFEERAKQYLEDLDKRYSEECNKQAIIKWDYVVNVNNQTLKASTDAETGFMRFQGEVQKEILTRFPNWTQLKDESIRRQFQYLSIAGPGTMPQEDVFKMNELAGEMEADYSTVTICEYKNPSNCNLRLDPEIEHILETSRDPDELAYYWTVWHDTMSKRVPPEKYQNFLSYTNALAKANGFQHVTEMWMVAYDDKTPGWTWEKFKQQMISCWEELKPLYEVFHAYVRMKLKRTVFAKQIDECGYIPAHVTGNMWAQNWAAQDSYTKPFPNAPSLDITRMMNQQNYTVQKMLEVASEFFTGLGLPPMTETFWKKSMFERPSDGRSVVCHAQAEDFCNGKGGDDFRISMCTKVTMDDLYTIHHEMGHVAYFQQYKDEPYIFREGANPGFHEAIGDALALAVVTPKHLQCVLGLQLGLNITCDNKPGSGGEPQSVQVTETDINYLYLTALQKLLIFPYSISLEMWRWDAFEGKISPNQYNKRFWELLMANLGIKPNSSRDSPNLFDPAGKYHIVTDTEYLRYFVSHILQFQFYEAMCIASGEFSLESKDSKPLYQCDFSGSKKAGELLGTMMKLGYSKPWPDALEIITGKREMSTSSLKNYMKPLLDHMKKELDANGEIPGWGPGKASCES